MKQNKLSNIIINLQLKIYFVKHYLKIINFKLFKNIYLIETLLNGKYGISYLLLFSKDE
jgi:hypothetical protein